MQDIYRVGKLLVDVLQNGRTIFWCGNGGSAADSQHLAAELVGRFKLDRRPFRSVSLSTDSSVTTCIANDYSFDSIYSRQIEALGCPGDVVVCISTSGNSTNILSALQISNSMQIHSVGLLGRDGGKAKHLADHSIIVPSQSTARIQEAHILIGHCLCEFIEESLLK